MNPVVKTLCFYGKRAKSISNTGFSNIVIFIHLNAAMTLAAGGVSNSLTQQTLHCSIFWFKQWVHSFSLFCLLN